MNIHQWLKNPQKNVPFVMIRKTELTGEGLSLDVEICCLGITHFAKHWTVQLKGESFNIKEVELPYEESSIFTYQGYDFTTHWISKDVIGVSAEVIIL